MTSSDLSQRWQALWHGLNARGDGAAIFAELEARYSEPLRAYHNPAHLRHCLCELDRFDHPQRMTIELAVWFHDAIYDPKANDNEERSAELLRERMQHGAVPREIVERAAALVLATKTHDAVDEASRVMLDCDLAILGAAHQRFREYERQIRTEYGWVPEAAYRAGRSNVLSKFLERARIFCTDELHTRYEEAARKNLAWSLAQLKAVPLPTRFRRVLEPASEILSEAADVLKAGQLVAFPTETVYGLGANALSADAVAKIFVAKGRPSNNPVIVHVSDASAARELVREWPEIAQKLSDAFWPGPLTLVLPKSEAVPDAVTAGGPTIGIRCPQHPIALGLLKSAGIPIAAPSANRSTEISPTRAEHVLESLDGRIELLLDGGPCSGGIESTVLDLSVSPPRLLRPGLVTPAQIETIIGRIDTSRVSAPKESAAPLPSPGLLERHYAPKARLEVAHDNGASRVNELLALNRKVGWLMLENNTRTEPDLIAIIMPKDAAGYAARLYAVLHELDASGVEHIVVSAVPESGEWIAISDRLKRASHPG